jgi:multidrug transporter EmrE-like cation transporter
MIVVTARVFFGETVTLARWAGVCLIAIGIGMIAPT